MREEWIAIKGYEERYMVSNRGRVKSLERLAKCRGDGMRIVAERVLIHRTAPNGYRHVALYRNGKPKRGTIHRLVAEAFIDNPENKPYVNHIDGNKINNYSSNLEWCTRYENMQHASEIGLLNAPKGRSHYKNKKIVQLDFDGTVIEQYYSITNASKLTGVNRGNISNCANGLVKSAGGYLWRYATK